MNNIKTISRFDEIYKCGVYKLYHSSSPDIFYIGSASAETKKRWQNGFRARFKGHISALNNGKHHVKHFQDIKNNIGIVDGFIMEIIELCSPDKCIERERFYIDSLRPSLNVYKNANSPLGHKFPKEYGQAASIRRKGKLLPASHKEAISRSMKGKTPANIATLHSKESRIKASIKLTGRKADPVVVALRFKPVYQLDKLGNVVERFDSINHASDKTGINRSAISLCAGNKRQSAGGFIWILEARAQGFKKSKFTPINKAV